MRYAPGAAIALSARPVLRPVHVQERALLRRMRDVKTGATRPGHAAGAGADLCGGSLLFPSVSALRLSRKVSFTLAMTPRERLLG